MIRIYENGYKVGGLPWHERENYNTVREILDILLDELDSTVDPLTNFFAMSALNKAKEQLYCFDTDSASF